ncbi:MAG: hypothetical protein HXL62_00065 [Streptococcus sp.]|nr:hypothetical protein [Streptococcus sp.]
MSLDKELMNVFNDLEGRKIVDRRVACIKNDSKKEVEVELQLFVRNGFNSFLEGSIDLLAVTIDFAQLDIVFVFNLKTLITKAFPVVFRCPLQGSNL